MRGKADLFRAGNFDCLACGHTEQADVHAAKNILVRGWVVWNELLEQSAAGHAASAHEGILRRMKVSKPKVVVPLKWEPAKALPKGCTEEVMHA